VIYHITDDLWPSPPVIGVERAEEKLFVESMEKNRIISRYRTKIGKEK
jgi:hypothetical protein